MRLSFVMFIGLSMFCGCNDASNPSQTSDAVFRHKLECEKYQQPLEVKAKEQNRFDLFGHDMIYSVFYSSKRNSCLVAKFRVLTHPNPKEPVDAQTDIYAETLEIDDLLDHQRVWAKDYDEAQEDSEVAHTLDAQMDALK